MGYHVELTEAVVDYLTQVEGLTDDFEFIVDASHLEMGVVRVVYVECTIEPL